MRSYSRFQPASCPTGCPDALSGGLVNLDDLDTRYWKYTMEWKAGKDGAPARGLWTRRPPCTLEHRPIRPPGAPAAPTHTPPERRGGSAGPLAAWPPPPPASGRPKGEAVFCLAFAPGYLKWYYDDTFVWGMDAASFGSYTVCEERAGVGEPAGGPCPSTLLDDTAPAA